MTAAQLNRQLKTWKDEMPEIYKEIMQYAEMQGIALGRNSRLNGKFVSSAKKKARKLAKFAEQYQNEYGSYSAWEAKTKRRIKYLKNRYFGETDYSTYGDNWKEIWKSINRFNELADQLWEMFGSNASGETADEIAYLKTLPYQQAVRRMEKEIKEGRLLGIEDYKNQYGDYESPYKRRKDAGR